MTQILLPYRPIAGDPEDVSQVIADFDAILAVVNGDLRDDNISPSAAIQATKLAAIPGSRIVFSRGTTPPASPGDGDLWQFAADAANGVYWMFRYNAGSASAYKWEYLGGSPMEAVQAGADPVLNTGVYTGSASIPNLTAVRAGDYDIEFGSRPYFSGTVAWQGVQSPKLGAAAAQDADAAIIAGANPAGSTTTGHVQRRIRRTLAANDAVQQMFKTAGGQGVGFTAIFHRLYPVRVS